MNWTGLLIFVAVVVAFMLLRRVGQISVQKARNLISKGAVVVDVRSTGEFASGHLPWAINIPLDDIEEVLPGRFPDRMLPILLHCQSGMRSGIARSKLRGIGYTNAFNLGSFSRAAQIVRRR
jgi:phage shock protein E